MIWTKDRPKLSGWYWTRRKNGRIHPIYVADPQQGFVADSLGGELFHWVWLDGIHGERVEWSDCPIPLSQESKSEEKQ